MALPVFTILKTSCYNYTITNNQSDSWAVRVYTFEDYKNGNPPFIIESLGTDLDYDLVLPDGDNVYIIKLSTASTQVIIDPEDKTAQDVTNYYMVIYEYCALEQCFQLLLKDLLCNETLCNPNTDCAGNDLMNAEGLKRIEIMKISVLYLEMLMLIHAEQMAYLDKFEFDESREDRLQRANDNIKRIQTILLHCGLCGSVTFGQSNCSPCSSCN